MMILSKTFLILIFVLQIERLNATEFEKLGTSIAKTLGTTKAVKTSVKVEGKEVDIFYVKDGTSKPFRFAVVQKGIYEPNCTHTWVIGLTNKDVVNDIRVVEMSCPHAFPTREKSFLDQYIGKGPKDLSTMKTEIHAIAKATGSAELTTTAVITSIRAVGKFILSSK